MLHEIRKCFVQIHYFQHSFIKVCCYYSPNEVINPLFSLWYPTYNRSYIFFLSSCLICQKILLTKFGSYLHLAFRRTCQRSNHRKWKSFFQFFQNSSENLQQRSADRRCQSLQRCWCKSKADRNSLAVSSSAIGKWVEFESYHHTFALELKGRFQGNGKVYSLYLQKVKIVVW